MKTKIVSAKDQPAPELKYPALFVSKDGKDVWLKASSKGPTICLVCEHGSPWEVGSVDDEDDLTTNTWYQYITAPLTITFNAP